MPVIGWLGATEANDRLLTVFRKALAEAGYVEGRNVAIEYRWAEGRYDRMPAMAAELVRRPVAMIVASPTPAALVAKAASATIPIVFGVTDDPVKLGLVTSLARPEGNATGVYFFLSDLAGKQLGLLRELVPAAKRIGLLVNPDNANAEALTREMAAAASAIGVQLELMRASNLPAIHTAVAALAREADALVVGADPFFFSRRVQLVTLTTRHATGCDQLRTSRRREVSEPSGGARFRSLYPPNAIDAAIDFPRAFINPQFSPRLCRPAAAREPERRCHDGCDRHESGQPARQHGAPPGACRASAGSSPRRFLLALLDRRPRADRRLRGWPAAPRP
jgi:putative ABC transport system substrate-binding protein